MDCSALMERMNCSALLERINLFCINGTVGDRSALMEQPIYCLAPWLPGREYLVLRRQGLLCHLTCHGDFVIVLDSCRRFLSSMVLDEKGITEDLI